MPHTQPCPRPRRHDRRPSEAVAVAAALLLATPCLAWAQTPEAGAVQDSTDIVFSITGLSGPEAVRYDPDQDVYFVASFGESGDDPRDAN
ncbi:MAG TPA: hypothetical protein VM778_14955, partial [Gemmatimonadota bacterium]|nr:hypothetical protein [Gemmatimonadota bacterium]